MENENTNYKEGSGDEFTNFLFNSPPKEKNSIKLELNPCDKNIKIGLHIFQELLMIFVGGIKYLFSKDKNCMIQNLTFDDINLMNQYFESIGFNLWIQKFTMVDYLNNMKLPNYFINKELIKDKTPLKDIYYETSHNYIIYRIHFDFLN